MIAATFLLTIVGTFVNDSIVEPRLGRWTAPEGMSFKFDKISKTERQGLWAAGITFVLVLGVFYLLTKNPGGIFQLAEDSAKPFKTALEAFDPLFKSLVMILTLLFLFCGLSYGIVAKTIRTDKQVSKMMADALGTMGHYLVLAFVAAQFVSYFRDSNLGIITAIQGADFLKAMNLTGIPALLIFVIIAASINLLIGSASAKWAILAPVFVPMMMLQGLSPELTQASYRVGDSVTNIITPLLPYFPLIVAFAQKYDKKAGIGTVISCTLPYSIAFGIMWSIMLIVWMLVGMDLGPGGPLQFDMGLIQRQ
jgi:aminobenzoyl-glutamate transport protein